MSSARIRRTKMRSQRTSLLVLWCVQSERNIVRRMKNQEPPAPAKPVSQGQMAANALSSIWRRNLYELFTVAALERYACLALQFNLLKYGLAKSCCVFICVVKRTWKRPGHRSVLIWCLMHTRRKNKGGDMSPVYFDTFAHHKGCVCVFMSVSGLRKWDWRDKTRTTPRPTDWSRATLSALRKPTKWILADNIGGAIARAYYVYEMRLLRQIVRRKGQRSGGQPVCVTHEKRRNDTHRKQVKFVFRRNTFRFPNGTQQAVKRS